MSSRYRTPAVVGVAVIRPHVMRLLFDAGVVRDVEYVPGKAHGSLLVPLEDPVYFAQVRVDPEARTVVWPNGLDLAPEVFTVTTNPTMASVFTTSRRTSSPDQPSLTSSDPRARR